MQHGLVLTWAGAVFGAQLALAQLGGSTLDVTQSLEVDGDGIADFEVVERETTFSYPGGLWTTWVTWLLQPADHERARGNLILTNPLVLAAGDPIPLDPVPPTRWQTNQVLLLSASIGTGTGWTSSDGPLMNSVGAFFGVKLAASDGAHLAWLQGVQTETRPGWRPAPRIVDSGYQPEPGIGLRVGEKPSAPARDEVTTFVPVDLRGTGQFDFTLCVTRWTNRTDGASGVSAVLTNAPGFEVMAAPGFIEGRSVLFADPMPERAPIPENPAGPGRWSVGDSGLVLWDVVFPSGAGEGRAVGPLASQPQVIVALRGVNRPDIRAGWMTFTRDFQLVGSHVASDYYPAAGITHPPSAWRDVNGDGWIDFAIRDYAKHEAGPRFWLHWEGKVLDCLTGSAVLAGGSAPEAMKDCREAVALEPGQLIAKDPAASTGEWQTNAVGLHGTFSWYQDFGGAGEASYRFVGYMGLCFQARDGLHYGWWDGSHEAFEPRPGHPLAAAQTPTSLGAYVRDGEMVVSWNRSLTGYELQSTPSLTAPTWVLVSPGSAGRVVLPLSGEGCYLRLRGAGEPRP